VGNPSWQKQAAKPVIGFRAEYQEDRKSNFLKKSYLQIAQRLTRLMYSGIVKKVAQLKRIISSATVNERIARGDSRTIKVNFFVSIQVTRRFKPVHIVHLYTL